MTAGLARQLAYALGIAGCLLGRPAQAHEGLSERGLSAAERQAMLQGGRIERPLRAEVWNQGYVGGIAYQLVQRPPEAVLSALLEVRNLREMLPGTRSARWVGMRDGCVLVELVQGRPPFLARFTVALQRRVDQGELRFWLDPAYPHDVRDVYGFFRVRSFAGGRALLTVAAAVDLGPGLFSGLFEHRVESTVLASVTTIKDFLEPRRLAAASD